MAAVDTLKMPEKEDELLQVSRRELPVDAMEGMGHGMGDRVGKKVFLKIKNIFTGGLDVAVLRFGDAPDQDGNSAFIIRKMPADFLADDHIRKMRDFKASVNGVLIRERHILHSSSAKFFVEIAGVGKTGRKIEAAQHPIGRPLTIT